MQVGVIGTGRFGQHYARTFIEVGADLKWACSKTKESCEGTVCKLQIAANTTTDYHDILADKEVEAVAIITPGSLHAQQVREALEAEKHVIVEKPLAFSVKEAQELLALAEKKNKILMMSHLHYFNPGLVKIREDIAAGTFGKIRYIHIVHTGNGPIRTDMNALWDFMPHTTSIFLDILGELPESVEADGAAYLNEGVEDVVTFNANFKDAFVDGFASWLYPEKQMKVTIVGAKKYAVFDDYAENKLTYYGNVPEMKEGKGIIPQKEPELVKVEEKMPLAEQLKHFMECVKANKKPKTYDHMLNVTKILEAAQKSLENKGELVRV